MINFQDMADEFARNMNAQRDAAFVGSHHQQQPFGSGPHFNSPWFEYIKDIRPDTYHQEPDIDSLETIDKYNLRKGREIEIENEQERRHKREELLQQRRKEALKAFKEWNGAMAGGVNVKPLCALCDKTVDYLTCRPVFYSLHNPQSWLGFHKLALKSISYVAYCHGEQQSFITVPEGFKNWQGFALTTAFNFKGDK